jgi:hypothetical protein
MITPALVVASPGAPFTYQDVVLDDTLREGEVLVEMRATGVCHTDLNFSKETTMPGLFPAVFGHEGWRLFTLSSLHTSSRFKSPLSYCSRYPCHISIPILKMEEPS